VASTSERARWPRSGQAAQRRVSARRAGACCCSLRRLPSGWVPCLATFCSLIFWVRVSPSFSPSICWCGWRRARTHRECRAIVPARLFLIGRGAARRASWEIQQLRVGFHRPPLLTEFF